MGLVLFLHRGSWQSGPWTLQSGDTRKETQPGRLAQDESHKPDRIWGAPRLEGGLRAKAGSEKSPYLERKGLAWRLPERFAVHRGLTLSPSASPCHLERGKLQAKIWHLKCWGSRKKPSGPVVLKTHTFLHTLMRVHTLFLTHTLAHKCTHTYPLLLVHAHTHTHMLTHTLIYTHTLTYIISYTHTHTHAHTLM